MKVIYLKKLVKILIKEMLEPSTEPEGWSQSSSQSSHSIDYLNQLIELANLSEKERRILKLRLDGFTHEEIAEKYNVTAPRIRIIEQRAVRKLQIARGKDMLGTSPSKV